MASSPTHHPKLLLHPDSQQHVDHTQQPQQPPPTTGDLEQQQPSECIATGHPDQQSTCPRESKKPRPTKGPCKRERTSLISHPWFLAFLLPAPIVGTDDPPPKLDDDIKQATAVDVDIEAALPTLPSSSPTPAAETKTQAQIQVPAHVIRWIDRGTLIPTLQDPRSYTPKQKMSIVLIVAVASFSAPFASNIIMPSFPFIGPALKMNNTGVSLTSECAKDA